MILSAIRAVPIPFAALLRLLRAGFRVQGLGLPRQNPPKTVAPKPDSPKANKLDDPTSNPWFKT